MSEVHHPNYVKIWAILVVLLVISVTGPLLEIPVVTMVTAFGIACVKAFLVIKNFMHLTVEKRIAGYMLTTALVFMFLFFAGTATDVMRHKGDQWEKPLLIEMAAEMAAHPESHDDHH